MPPAVIVNKAHADTFDALPAGHQAALQPLPPDGPAFAHDALGNPGGWAHGFIPNPEATPDPATGLFGVCVFLGVAKNGQAIRKLVHQHVAEQLPVGPDDVVLTVPLGARGVFPAANDGPECAALAEIPSVILPREVRGDSDPSVVSDAVVRSSLSRETFKPASRRAAPPTASETANAAPIWHVDETTGERQLRTDVVYRQREIFDKEVTAEEKAKLAYRRRMGLLDPIETHNEPAAEHLDVRADDVARAISLGTATCAADVPIDPADVEDARTIVEDIDARIKATHEALVACDERIASAERARDNYLARIVAAHTARPEFLRGWSERYVRAVIDSGLDMDGPANRSDPSNILYHLHIDDEEEGRILQLLAEERSRRAGSRRRRPAAQSV